MHLLTTDQDQLPEIPLDAKQGYLYSISYRDFLERHCDTDTLVMTGHFPSPSVGHVRRLGDGFDFAFRE